MVGEQYYLILLLKNGEKLRVYSKPMTLKAIDERTVKYKSKKELVEQIIKNANLKFSESDVEEVRIVMKPNSKEEVYKEEYGPLYEEDKNVLNYDMIGAEFEIKARDPKFVLSFVQPYSRVKNFKPTVNMIFSLIKEKENYYEELQILVDKISKTYKGCRNMYLSMRFYDKSKEDSKKSKVKFSPSGGPIYSQTPLEIRENELLYLREYDRECLDISDFDGYDAISPFDGTERKK